MSYHFLSLGAKGTACKPPPFSLFAEPILGHDESMIESEKSDKPVGYVRPMTMMLKFIMI